jgi:Na+/H+-dicarboxylate symporter
VALVISFGIVRIFPISKYIDATLPKQIPAPKLAFLDALAPNVLYVITLAVLVGLIARRLSVKIPTLEIFFSKSLKGLIKALSWIIKLIPVAIFCVIAKLVGENGFKFFSTLGIFVLLVSAGIFTHVFIYYALVVRVSLKKSPVSFFKDSSEALLTAFGTGSSLATLPVTLSCLEKMKVSKSSARLSACIGTNFNHDGILLYEVTAAFFIAQIQGLHLGFSQQLTIASASILASVGIAGIPEAGLITLSLVLTAAHLPLTALPFLLPVDWFLGRLRAFTNVASDIIVANLLDGNSNIPYPLQD